MRLRENHAVAAVLAALPSQLRPRVDQSAGPASVEISAGGRQTLLYPQWIGEGLPRDAHRALDRLDSATTPDECHVLVGRRLSKRTREFLNERAVNWVDETGRARITTRGGVFIDRDRALDLAEVQSLPPAPRWSESSGAVAEFLLSGLTLAPGEPRTDTAQLIPRAAELAQSLDWSPQQINKVLQLFDSMGWSEKAGAERGVSAQRWLVDPAGLLSAWAGWHRSRRIQHIGGHTRWHDAMDYMGAALLPHLPIGTYALTGWAALALTAPYSSDVPTVALYLDGQLYDNHITELMDRADLRPVPTGARVVFYRAERSLSRHETSGGMPVVSPVRLYGDLLRSGLRGEDAAEHLRETVLDW